MANRFSVRRIPAGTEGDEMAKSEKTPFLVYSTSSFQLNLPGIRFHVLQKKQN